MRKGILFICAFALMLVAITPPHANAVGGNTYFTNNTTVGTCGTLCKGLTTTSGSSSTATVVSSFVENSVPALDTGGSSDKVGIWSAGSTISITTWATAQSADTILVMVSSSKTTTPCQSAPSAITGIVWDGSARKELGNSAGNCLSEWVGHASGTIASTTVTCNLSATPTWGICEAMAINGAEDDSGTFGPFDKAAGTSGFVCTGQRTSGSGTLAPITSTNPGASCSLGQTTSLNANDFVIGIEGDTGTTTNTAGSCGGATATFIHTTASTGGLSVERRAASATWSAATCAFGTATSRWNIFFDALQAKPKYFKVEPETSASLTGTPSVAANSFSGTGWVLNTAGIASGLTTILAGTWGFDTKNAIGATTGSPKVWYWVEAWDCTTNSCTTATNIMKNWDIATAIGTSTSQTAFAFTSASINAYTFPAADFLGFEVWAVLQYSGTTTSTTLTFSTIASSTTDFKPSLYGYASSISQSITIASALSHVTSWKLALAQSITEASALTHVTSWKDSLTQTITDNSALTKTANHIYGLAQSITASSSLGKIANHFYALAQSITDASSKAVTWTSTNLICQLRTAGSSTCTSNPSQTISDSSAMVHPANHPKSLSQSISVTHSMTAQITQFFFHGHKVKTCTSPSTTCQYLIFFDEIPAAASAEINLSGRFESLTASITSNSNILFGFQYSRALSQSIVQDNANYDFSIPHIIQRGVIWNFARGGANIYCLLFTDRKACHADEQNYFIVVHDNAKPSVGRFATLTGSLSNSASTIVHIGKVFNLPGTITISAFGQRTHLGISIPSLNGQINTNGNAICTLGPCTPPVPPFFTLFRVAIMILIIGAGFGMFLMYDRKKKKKKEQ